MNKTQHIDLSIIITTYNNKESLEKTFDAISAQDNLDSINYEIILVDNNSNDGTKGFVEDYVQSKNLRIKYVFEKEQGICFARNTGIKHVQGDIVAFTDDDCRPDQYWMKTLIETYKQYNPDTVQGKVDWGVVIPEDIFYPRWFLEERIAKVDYFNSVREFVEQDLVGANMSMRRSVLEKSGGFSKDPLFRVNEDTELSRRLTKMGFKKLYNPLLVMHHHFNLSRLNDKKLFVQSYYFGRSSIVLENSNIKWYKHLRFCLKLVIVNIFVLMKNYAANNKRSIFLIKCRLAALWGRCVQLIRTNIFKVN